MGLRTTDGNKEKPDSGWVRGEPSGEVESLKDEDFSRPGRASRKRKEPGCASLRWEGRFGVTKTCVERG